MFFSSKIAPSDLFNNGLMVSYKFEKLLKSENIDLVVLNMAPPALKYEIMTKCVPIYRKTPELFERFFSVAIREFLDFRYFSDVHTKTAFDYLERGT